ncbi:MAG: AAA family ATPase [Acidimicrobiia bacterium]|nr:AAA family ATPase [Acidimicrobiia bacterium]
MAVSPAAVGDEPGKSPFTPSRDDPAALRARTVGRDDLTASIVDRIDQAASGRNRIHTLLIGLSGSGKTHLVEAVLHDLGQRPGSKRLYMARLDEDMVGVATYADLLVSIAEKFNADGLLTATATEFRQLDGDPERQRVLREAVGDRVLVLVLKPRSTVRQH